MKITPGLATTNIIDDMRQPNQQATGDLYSLKFGPYTLDEPKQNCVAPYAEKQVTSRAQVQGVHSLTPHLPLHHRYL